MMQNDEKESLESTLEMPEHFHCDWKGKCRRKPYVEVFPYRKRKKNEKRFCPMDNVEFVGGWSYLCRRHFYRAWVESYILHLRLKFGWSDVCEECMQDDEPYYTKEVERMSRKK